MRVYAEKETEEGQERQEGHGVLMSSLAKPNIPTESTRPAKSYPSLCLGRDAISGIEGLTVDDEITLTFKARVAGVHKSQWDDGNGHVDFELLKGDISNISKDGKSIKAAEKLKNGMKAIQERMKSSV